MSKGPLRIWIHGISGRMGHICEELIAQNPTAFELVGGSGHDFVAVMEKKSLVRKKAPLQGFLETCDAILDFSTPTGNAALLEICAQMKTGKPILIATTGLKSKELAAWAPLSAEKGFKILVAPNTSIGVFLMSQTARAIGKVLKPLGFDIEIMETHHREKVDAPSGTAKFLAESIANTLKLKPVYGREGKRSPQEIGISSLRGGQVFGEHEVMFLGDHEELTIKHRALSRALFAQGALKLVQWLKSQKPALYSLSDVSLEDLLK